MKKANKVVVRNVATRRPTPPTFTPTENDALSVVMINTKRH
jgi:hypothetical protein